MYPEKCGDMTNPSVTLKEEPSTLYVNVPYSIISSPALYPVAVLFMLVIVPLPVDMLINFVNELIFNTPLDTSAVDTDFL